MTDANTNLSPIKCLILANHKIAQVQSAIEDLRPWLEARAEVLAEFNILEITPDLIGENESLFDQAELALVFGGDGTLLAQARLLAGRGIPLVGVNFGKLGFLAEFNIDDLKTYWDQIVQGQCRRSSRMLLNVSRQSGDLSEPLDPNSASRNLALNDVVITAGEPFRMIELALTMDPDRWGTESATTFSCDGVIVSTPSGSTAYNLAAGGPILSPQTDVICITPICPHSLAFRPIVIGSQTPIQIRLVRANAGTTLVLDGQESTPLEAGEAIRIQKHAHDIELIQNPTLSFWRTLAHKMHWAARPRRG